ncbi:MAG: hypothetical protein WDO15_23690 [Bacteroidota bacterium]
MEITCGAKRIGSTAFVERGEDVEVDADGYIYTVGLFQTTVDFDPGRQYSQSCFGRSYRRFHSMS